MKSYIEIKVPISFDEYWFQELRDLLNGVDIRWQRGYYHITMAFLDFAPDGVNMVPGLNDILSDAVAKECNLLAFPMRLTNLCDIDGVSRSVEIGGIHFCHITNDNGIYLSNRNGMRQFRLPIENRSILLCPKRWAQTDA